MSKPTTQLTGDEYRARNGVNCPYCLNDSQTELGKPTEIDGYLYTQTECTKCQKSWFNKYFLTDYVEQLPSPQP